MQVLFIRGKIMKKIKPSNENEMVYEFLKMEFDSDRFKKQIETVLEKMCITKDIITNGNIMCEKENTLRIKILKRFRGYKDEELFENFPTNVEWIWTEFEREDLPKIIYIEYSYWNELSNYTGSPLEAAKTILSGKTIYDVPNDSAIEGAKKLREGHKFPPMIFLMDESEKRYLILEGHGRMTAYGLASDLFQNVSVLLGYCDSEELGKWYGEMPKRPK
ncbi:MAG: hypothetical protein FWD90_09000 [Defluviitaleaceae bacterium]|nr:hypothetical protein [Defluviitaleaceae bacterium]